MAKEDCARHRAKDIRLFCLGQAHGPYKKLPSHSRREADTAEVSGIADMLRLVSLSDVLVDHDSYARWPRHGFLLGPPQ